MFASDKSLISSCLSSDNIKSNSNIQSGFQDLEHLVKTVQRKAFNGGFQRSSYKAQNLKSKGLLVQSNPYDRHDTLNSIGNHIPLTPSHKSEVNSQLDLTFKRSSELCISSPNRHNPSLNLAKNNQRMFEIEKLLSPRKMYSVKQGKFTNSLNSNKGDFVSGHQFLVQTSITPTQNKLKKKIDYILNEQATKPKLQAFTHINDKKPAFKLYKPQSPTQSLNTNNFYSPIRFSNASKFGLLDLAQAPNDQMLKFSNKVNIYDKYFDRDSITKFKEEFKIDQQVSLMARTFSGTGK